MPERREFLCRQQEVLARGPLRRPFLDRPKPERRQVRQTEGAETGRQFQPCGIRLLGVSCGGLHSQADADLEQVTPKLVRRRLGYVLAFMAALSLRQVMDDVRWPSKENLEHHRMQPAQEPPPRVGAEGQVQVEL